MSHRFTSLSLAFLVGCAPEPSSVPAPPSEQTVSEASPPDEPSDPTQEEEPGDGLLEEQGPSVDVAPIGFGVLEFQSDTLAQPFTPLARLTNREFRTSLGALMDLDEQQTVLFNEQVILPPEASIRGLASLAEHQDLLPASLEQLGAAADLAVSIRMGDDVSLANFSERLGCPDPERAAELCIRDEARLKMERGFRGAMSLDDIERLDGLMTVLDQIFADQVVALGRELTDDEKLVNLDIRLTAAIRLIVSDPKFQFLYETGRVDQEHDGVRPLTSVEIANRMAYFTTGAPPDAELLTAAQVGLEDVGSRTAQVDRLMASPANVEAVVQTLLDWLALDESKASEESIAEVQDFLQDWVTQRRPFAELYTAPVSVQQADGSESTETFGILGLEGVIASHTSAPTPSFINRGEFIVDTLLCTEMPIDVPDAALIDVEDPVEVFELHAQSACATCHHIFDNYGAALQRFDVDTNLYDPDNDWLGQDFQLYPIGDIEGPVSDPAELSQRLGESRRSATCMASLWVRHGMRRNMLDSGTDALALERIVDTWLATDTSMVSLLEVIVAREDFGQMER